MHLRSCESIDYVRRYIQILYHLSEKPYTVQVIEVLEEEDYLYIITELLEGKNLSSLIIEETFTEANGAQVFKTVVEVLHRDISLVNFRLAVSRDFSSIKTMCFGLSVFCETDDSHQIHWTWKRVGSCLPYSKHQALVPSTNSIDAVKWNHSCAAGCVLWTPLKARHTFAPCPTVSPALVERYNTAPRLRIKA